RTRMKFDSEPPHAAVSSTLDVRSAIDRMRDPLGPRQEVMESRDVEGDGKALRGLTLPGARMHELEARASGGESPDRPGDRAGRPRSGAVLWGGRARLESRVVDGRDAPRVACSGILGQTHGDGVTDPDGDDAAVVRTGDRHLSHGSTA